MRNITLEIAPSVAGLQAIDHWAGLRPFAADGLPILGDINGIGGLMIATAHYRNGILLAPLTAKLAADKLVNGADSRYFADFSPERFKIRGVAKSI